MSEKRISKKTLRVKILENWNGNTLAKIHCQPCGNEFIKNFEKCDFTYYHDFEKDYVEKREDDSHMLVENYVINVKCPKCKNELDFGLVVKMDAWKN